MKEKLIILCFEVQDVEIHIYNIDEDDDVDEEYIRKLGFDPDYCQWSFGSTLKIITHP